MYRKNTATQYIYFGLINATSGAALTGATVTAYRALDGNAQASATGTTTELGNGQYRFNLSQADTNANNGSYLFTATNAIPVEKTVVFTAADPTDATAFGLSRIDAAITSRMATFTLPTNFSSLAITAGGAVTAGTVSDKTGYSLASGGLASVTAWTVAITGNITGNLSGSVGSVTSGVTVSTNNDKTGYSLSQAFPSNFASLGINASGHISRVVLVDTVSAVTGLTASNLDAAISSRLAPTVSGRTLDVTATGAAGIDWGNIENQGSQVILSDTSISNAATVDQTDLVIALAAGATISGGVDDEIAAAVAATQPLTRLDSMIESNGSGQFRFDTIALENAPTGGGGGSTDWTANERTAIRSILGIPTSGTTPTDPSVGILDTIRDTVGSIGLNVYPVSASTPERVNGTTLTFYLDESRSVSIATDFTLTSMTLEFVVEDSRGNDIYTVANASITKSSQTATIPITSTVTGSLGQYNWSLRDITTGNSVIARGVLSVQNAASIG